MIDWGLRWRIHWAAPSGGMAMRRRVSFRGVRFCLPKTLWRGENRPSSNRVGASARPAIRYALILALVLGAFLVLTTAAVADPTPTAPFSTAATATPLRISALGHNVAGMESAEAQRRPKTEITGRGVRKSPLSVAHTGLFEQVYWSRVI
jgi:hypothetical protein